MSVKPSYISNVMRITCHFGIGLACISSLSGCGAMGMSSPSDWWREFRGKREPQIVSGVRRLPQNQQEMQIHPGAVPAGATDSNNYAPPVGNTPAATQKSYVPGQPQPSETQPSQPVILKHNNTSPNEHYDDGGHTQAPATLVQPLASVKETPSDVTSKPGTQRVASRFTLVANVETALLQEDEIHPPIRKPIVGNPAYGTADDPEVPSLDSVPKTPPRLRQLLNERIANESALKETHAQSASLRADLEQQRTDEASGSLLLPENVSAAPVEAEPQTETQ